MSIQETSLPSLHGDPATPDQETIDPTIGPKPISIEDYRRRNGRKIYYPKPQNLEDKTIKKRGGRLAHFRQQEGLLRKLVKIAATAELKLELTKQLLQLRKQERERRKTKKPVKDKELQRLFENIFKKFE